MWKNQYDNRVLYITEVEWGRCASDWWRNRRKMWITMRFLADPELQVWVYRSKTPKSDLRS